MRSLLRPLLLIGVLLVVLLLPFLAVGNQLDQWFDEWSAAPPARHITALVVIGILSTDILLPVPSSGVSTLAGWQLGTIWGTLASWVGMTLSAAIGFALALSCGRCFTRWFVGEEELTRMKATSDRLGPLFLIVMRGVPVLAEASVLLVGVNHLQWKRFLPPVLVSNFVISLVYAAVGNVAGHRQEMTLGIAIAVGVPIVLGLVVRRWLVSQ